MDFLNNLRALNRKERDWLTRFVFKDHCLKLLNTVLGWKFQSEYELNKAFEVEYFMDYHLNWLVFAAEHGESLQAESVEHRNGRFEGASPLRDSQQDVDALIVAIDKSSGEVHLILLEAKLDSGMDQEQLKKKLPRLTEISQRGHLPEKTHFVWLSMSRPSEEELEIMRDHLQDSHIKFGIPIVWSDFVPDMENNPHGRFQLTRWPPKKGPDYPGWELKRKRSVVQDAVTGKT